jgi:hypothetical protein
MCISQRDNTSPVAEDRISRVRVPRLPLEMRHLPGRSPKFWICDTAAAASSKSTVSSTFIVSKTKLKNVIVTKRQQQRSRAKSHATTTARKLSASLVTKK